jgi:two-component system sensor histidine kinase CiaH
MFRSARLQLTAWYLLIILLVSGVFSMAFYNVSTREVRRALERNTQENLSNQTMIFRVSPPRGPSLEELEAAQLRLRNSLFLINLVIIVVAGLGGYWLAGRTLQPIQQMVDEQNQFISNASHELRTPLATLQAEMEANLLQKKISDKEARELIKSNLEELDTLQNLANKLLRLTQLHSPFQKEQFEKVSLDLLLARSQRNLWGLAKKKQIDIFLPSTQLFVWGDELALQQLFTILFDNALKYSANKKEVIVLAKQQRNQVLVEVRDQGLGMSQLDQQHIFERFYRGDKARSGSEGFGLGLSIAQQIVSQHRGKLAVKSVLGKGSSFFVTLPLASKKEGKEFS